MVLLPAGGVDTARKEVQIRRIYVSRADLHLPDGHHSDLRTTRWLVGRSCYRSSCRQLMYHWFSPRIEARRLGTGSKNTTVSCRAELRPPYKQERKVSLVRRADWRPPDELPRDKINLLLGARSYADRQAGMKVIIGSSRGFAPALRTNESQIELLLVGRSCALPPSGPNRNNKCS